MLQHRVHAAAKKQVQGFIQAAVDSTPRQGFAKATAAPQLAVDQDAIAVEDDEVGLHDRRERVPSTIIYSSVGQLPKGRCTVSSSSTAFAHLPSTSLSPPSAFSAGAKPLSGAVWITA